MRQEEPLVMAALAACCLFAGTPLLAQEPPVAAQTPAEQLQELETVVVSGTYAEPQMWKISKGDHVLSIATFIIVVLDRVKPGS